MRPVASARRPYQNQVGTAGPAVRTNKHVTDVSLCQIKVGTHGLMRPVASARRPYQNQVGTARRAVRKTDQTR
jgi:hypothetical protein